MTVGIYGLGRFGSFWGSVLAKRFAVVAYDIDEDRKAPEGIERVGLDEICSCPVIFLCVPIRAVPSALRTIARRIGPEVLVADTCSVKVYPAKWMREILPPSNPLLATHPMFGPESAKDGLDGLAIMMDPLRLDTASARFWEDTFASFGLVPVVMDCDRHDKEAAYSQALTHFVGRSLHRLDLADTSIATRWYRKLHSVVKQCVRDSMDLFEDMQLFNPYAGDMRKELMECFSKTLLELESADSALGRIGKPPVGAAASAAENAMAGVER